jgi:hypothetical protein
MKFIADLVASKIAGQLHKKFQQCFPAPKIERGVAYVDDIEEVLVRENIFSGKQLVLCENIPPQTDHYLVYLVFEKQQYKIKSQQVHSRHTDVGIEYIQKIGGIEIVRIVKKSLMFQN